jgi:hypothetical protein
MVKTWSRFGLFFNTGMISVMSASIAYWYGNLTQLRTLSDRALSEKKCQHFALTDFECGAGPLLVIGRRGS